MISNSLSSDIHSVLAVLCIYGGKNGPTAFSFVRLPFLMRALPKETPEPAELFLSPLTVAGVYLPSSIILTQSAKS